MNIIIPLCGKGERFKKDGYKDSKPLITIFEKKIIFYVIDNLDIKKDDEIFIFYNTDLDKEKFTSILKYRYLNYHINFISINNYTKGASETIQIGIKQCLEKNIIKNRFTVCLDCDNFYTIDILSKIRKIINNQDGGVIYTINTDFNPIYSYININDNGKISDIQEKQKISDNINTGCYFFKSLEKLYIYSELVSQDSHLYMNGECYVSCIIKKMIDDNYIFETIKIDSNNYFNLGTPQQVKTYIENTHSFLFDLDGTLILTDDIYFEVWKEILEKYNITIDEQFYKIYIYGNNDLYVLNTVLHNINISLQELSTRKDTLFLKQLNKIILVEGVLQLFEKIKQAGHKIGIVTNCNRIVAENVIKYFEFDRYIDCLIIGGECKQSKPYPDPYLEACKFFNISNEKTIIFEDSNTGLLSAKNIFPKRLIAIRNINYNNLYNDLGVKFVIDNFVELKINELLKNSNDFIIENLEEKILFSLNKNKLFQDEKIKDIQIQNTKLKGGYISDVISLNIITDINNYYCILKLENKNESFLSTMANKLGLYEREYYFYEKISKFIPISIPKFYGIIYNENGCEIGILLENLFSNGLTNNVNLNNESIENSLTIINECSKLHSKFSNRDLISIFPNLKKHNDILFKPTWKQFMLERWSIFKDKWKFILTEFHIEIIEKVINNLDNIQDYLSEKNLTLCHGDVKSLNMFFQNNKPLFIDWQYINYGKGVQDIVFFLIESFNIEKIRDYHSLIKSYYYVKCKEYGMTTYTEEEYNKDFVYSILYFPLFVSIWFGTVSQDDLIDKNFPYFFIQKFLYVLDLYRDDILLLKIE